MKALIFTLAIILCAFTAQAATISWQHDGQNTDGYTIYFWETNVPGTVYNKTVMGNAVRQMEVEDKYFKPQVEYTFSGTAWNVYGESPRSNEAMWTRDVPIYGPPNDLLPTEINISTPGPVTININ